MSHIVKLLLNYSDMAEYALNIGIFECLFYKHKIRVYYKGLRTMGELYVSFSVI